MNLSKSKYCDGCQCIKKLWLLLNHPELASDTGNQTQFDNGTMVGELAKGLLGDYLDVSFSSNLTDMINQTNLFLENEKCVITEASFSYNNNFCSVDLLKKDGDNFSIYEVKSSTEVKDVYLDDISYQYYVLNNLGYNVSKCFIVHINSSYVRKGELSLDKLFNICDVTDIVLNKQDEVNDKILFFNESISDEEPLVDIGIWCTKPYDCPFFNYCSRNLENPNVFDIHGMSKNKKFDLYHDGKYFFDSLKDLNLNDKYLEQINFELNNLPIKINEGEVKSFLSKLSYPLYYLDFETYQQPVPEFDLVKPYMQIPFQYSLHYVLEEGGELFHTEFLGDGVTDPRRALAEKLVNDIPLGSCVIAYNMSFEKGRIKEMAEIFPDLSNHLMDIYNNMIDLMIPFKDRSCYCKEMKGCYSIKYVLPALFPDDESLNYQSLDMVHNGVDAMDSYARLSSLDDLEKEKLRVNMLKYCALDTFAMVKIVDKLKEFIS